ncbi:MAG: LuxR C-terminal-related transcriptional regulator [Candidatus Dormibacteraceae bacterium]
MFIFGTERLLADSVGALLARETDILVVGNAAWSADSAHRVATLQPDIVVMDFRDWTATEHANALSRMGSQAHLILLSSRVNDAFLITAFEVGASAVIDANRPAAELLATIRQVAQGAFSLKSRDVGRLLRRRRLDLEFRSSVTHREMEIVELLSTGASSRDMAIRLGIGYATIRTHIRNLCGKLSAHSKLEVLAKAREYGLVSDRSVPGVNLHEEAAAPGEVQPATRGLSVQTVPLVPTVEPPSVCA